MKPAVWLLCIGLSAAATPAMAQGRGVSRIRFQAMDVNGDGVITRAEWRGSDQAFRNHDWNGDGVLSGDEVRLGARRPATWDDRDIQDSIDREDDWTPERFRSLDHNGDGRLTRNEWHASAELFSRIDRNHDNVLSAAEFVGEDDVDPEDRFGDLDTNRDGRLTRNEWHGNLAVFDALDANRDGALTRAEALGNDVGARDDFRSVDMNGDGAIDQSEWHWNGAAFDRLDANHDGRLSRNEFDSPPAATPPLPQQNAAYRAGFERGHVEGVQAGREDKPRHWDLEGQRELETADSGYEPRFGARGDYQAGYRVGFRRGYREGFGPR